MLQRKLEKEPYTFDVVNKSSQWIHQLVRRDLEEQQQVKALSPAMGAGEVSSVRLPS
jgi:hypothetical protein